MRRMRKKRMKNTILLIALLLILVCGAGGLFYMLRGGIGSEPVMAYSTDREFQHQKTDNDRKKQNDLTFHSSAPSSVESFLLTVITNTSFKC